MTRSLEPPRRCPLSAPALLVLVTAVALTAGACDILRTDPFQIVSWSPGEGCVSLATVSVDVVFSVEPDTYSVARSTTLSADGTRIEGDWSWEGVRGSFVPRKAFEGGTEYLFSISQDAMTHGGLSLTGPFRARFFLGNDRSRPRVTASSPTDYGHISDDGSAILLEFSEAVDSASLRAAFSLNPSCAGMIDLSDDGTSARFIPVEPWSRDTIYRMDLSDELADLTGTRLAKEYELRFSLPSSSDAPRLVAAEMVTVACGTVPVMTPEPEAVRRWLVPDAETGGLERGDTVRLTFSVPVTGASFGAAVELAGGPSVGWMAYAGDGADGEDGEDESADGADGEDSEDDGAGGADGGDGADDEDDLDGGEDVADGEDSEDRGAGSVVWVDARSVEAARVFEARFDEAPAYGSRLYLSVGENLENTTGTAMGTGYRYTLVFDGAQSRPPTFAGLRFPVKPWDGTGLAPGMQIFSVDEPFATISLDLAPDGYPIGTTVHTMAELFFSVAPGARPDEASLARTLAVSSTNASVEIVPLSLDALYTSPVTPPPDWSGMAQVGVSVSVMNRVGSCIITWSVSDGLVDTLGNVSNRAASLPLLK